MGGGLLSLFTGRSTGALAHCQRYCAKANLQKKKSKKTFLSSESSDTQPELNSAQQQAVDAICAAQNTFKPFLLDGVTGSGKTEVVLAGN